MVYTQTLAFAAAFPVLQLFIRVYLCRNRRLLELSQPIITQIPCVLLHRLIFLQILPQDLSPVLQILQTPDNQDFIINCLQVHLSLMVHLLRFIPGNVYHLVDVVTLGIKSPWCLHLFTSHFFILLSSYADKSCGGSPEYFALYGVNTCVKLESISVKFTTSGSVRIFILF